MVFYYLLIVISTIVGMLFEIKKVSFGKFWEWKTMFETYIKKEGQEVDRIVLIFA